MAFQEVAIAAFFYLWNLFTYWLSIFFVFPLKNPEILWILIPVWINLIFTDFFQERHGASLGNAITNGAVQMWVGVDWLRYLWRTYKGISGLLMLNVSICLLTLFTGAVIVQQSLKHNKGVQSWGRIRVTSYLMIVFSPIVYGLAQPSFYYLFAVIVYSPIFYYVLEFIEYFVPELEEGSSFSFPR